ncbi:MAG: TIGR01212 family radical SAM protein [Candidatus Omnitrophota bacterium]|nr:MAG: TIGR01212 family radical SAM protein [Candidatus Omnitrophota bacterium]
MKDRFYSFNNYLKKMFGERIHRLSLDAGFSCPNLDATLSSQGCIYCNNRGFSRFAYTNSALESQIEESIEFYNQRYGVKKFIAYFQAFTNTYASLEELSKAYEVIKKYPEIVGLTISTRPDCVDEEKIKLISQYTKDYLVWIEYGLQTTHNHLLENINRNHTYEDFLKAFRLTRNYGINVGVHLILGLPSQNHNQILEDAKELASLDIQGIKFHVFHVLKDTPLEKMYEQKRVNLLDKEEYVKIVCDFLERIPRFFVILRLVSDASDKYLVAPSWINRKQEVIEAIKKELEKRETFQGYRLTDSMKTHESTGCKSK